MGRVPGELIPIVLFICGAAIVIFTPIAKAVARSIERKSESRTSPEVADRLDRMEHAIESIAIEIERISEGQRFTTKLLAEQKTRIGAGTERNEAI
jgi:hypothetical protein